MNKFYFLSCAFILSLPELIQGNPSGLEVQSGQASLETNSSQMHVHTSDKAILHWNQFSVAAEEQLHFHQPSSHSTVLNRVVGNEISKLDGLLKSNGHVLLVNPAGIIVGANGVIETASFIASTLNLSNDQFLNQKEWNFSGDSQQTIINLGKIHALDGDALLFGFQVVNNGQIEAPQGIAGGAAGSVILLKPEGQERIFIQSVMTNDSMEKIGWSHQGSMQADRIEIKSQGTLYEVAICLDGITDATALREEGGKIFLDAEEGAVHCTGKVSAHLANGEGGKIQMLGKRVDLFDGAHVNVSSPTDGGTVWIGGDGPGDSPIVKAKLVSAAPDVIIEANSTLQGNGGRIVLWGTDTNICHAAIEAKGGPEGGDGGFVEISSKGYLVPEGSVSTLAPMGKSGQLLLDPAQVTISTALDSAGITVFPPVGYTFGGAPPYNINTATLASNVGSYLNTNAVVTINASTSGADAFGSITILNDVVWAGLAGGSELVLIANDSPSSFVDIQARVESTNITVPAATTILDIQTSKLTITSTGLNQGVRVNSGALNINATGGPAPTLEMHGNADTAIIICGQAIPAVPAGDLTIVTDGMLLQGAVGAAEIQTTHGGSIDVTCHGDAQFLGGPTQYGRLFANNGGTVTLTVDTGGSLTLTGGSLIASGGNIIANIANDVTISGNFAGFDASNGGSINIMNVGGDFTILGGPGLNAVRTGGSGAGGNIDITVVGDISITAGAATSGFLTLNSGYINVHQAASFSLNGANAFVTTDNTGNIDINTTGAISALSGTIRTGVTAGTGDISLQAGGDVSLSGNGGTFQLRTRDGNIDVVGANVSLLGAGGTSSVLIDPTASSLHINISAINSPTADMILDDSASIQSGSTGNQIQLFANRSIEITNNSHITHSSLTGAVYLEADRQYPSPGVGPGRFVLDGTSTISGPADLGIWTALFSQNSVAGMLNGAPFTGVINTSDPQNQYLFYYNAGTITAPYTIFYKAFTVIPPPAVAGTVILPTPAFRAFTFELFYDLCRFPKEAIFSYGFLSGKASYFLPFYKYLWAPEQH